jgi:hypothetical protein
MDEPVDLAAFVRGLSERELRVFAERNEESSREAILAREELARRTPPGTVQEEPRRRPGWALLLLCCVLFAFVGALAWRLGWT